MLTQEQVKEYFDYNPITGRLTWRKATSNNKKWIIGKESGCIDSLGYRKVQLSKQYKAHRIIWLWMTGVFPENQIDHINGCRSDNRWCNLREATQSQNNRNYAHVKGYDFVKARGKYRVLIRPGAGRKQIYLGYFETEDEARKIYLEACEKYHGKEWMNRKR